MRLAAFDKARGGMSPLHVLHVEVFRGGELLRRLAAILAEDQNLGDRQSDGNVGGLWSWQGAGGDRDEQCSGKREAGKTKSGKLRHPHSPLPVPPFSLPASG